MQASREPSKTLLNTYGTPYNSANHPKRPLYHLNPRAHPPKASTNPSLAYPKLAAGCVATPDLGFGLRI